MYQSITVVGRLGRDPELKFMPNGQQVTSFSIATDRSYTGGDGQRQKETTWFRVSVFGKQAETCNQFLTKGRVVLVEGRLSVDAKTGGPRVYAKQDGAMAASFEILANDVRFLSSPDDGAKQDGRSAPQKGAASAKPVDDNDIPF